MSRDQAFRTGAWLVVCGLVFWLGLLVWTFGFGHSDDPISGTAMFWTGLGVFGPMLLGGAFMWWANR